MVIIYYFLACEIAVYFALYLLIGRRVVLYSFKRRRAEKISAGYDDLICSYLEPKEELVPFVFPGLDRKFNRNVLVDRIMSLMSRLNGVEAKMLLLMFRSNCLSGDTLVQYAGVSDLQAQKVLYLFSRIQAPPSTMFELGQYMFHVNRDVRMFAMLALFNYDRRRIIPVLRNFPYAIHGREQANIYDFISRHSVPLPNIELLADSRNGSVAGFGEKLMALYGMKPT